jgi:hypothetical protein
MPNSVCAGPKLRRHLTPPRKLQCNFFALWLIEKYCVTRGRFDLCVNLLMRNAVILQNCAREVLIGGYEH